MADDQAHRALDRAFPGGQWQRQEWFPAPESRSGEALGSTVPDYYNIGDGISPVPAARTGERASRTEIGLPAAQSQAHGHIAPEASEMPKKTAAFAEKVALCLPNGPTMAISKAKFDRLLNRIPNLGVGNQRNERESMDKAYVVMVLK